jgi:hypothetical protein
VSAISSISAIFDSPFGVSGELGVGTASILGANATATPNAASILAATQTSTGPLSVIANSLNTAVSPTIAALRTGELTTTQQKLLSALYSSSTPTSIPWNANGTEPSVVAQVRGYGWIKLVEPTYNQTTKAVASATYQLTPVGKAIAARTNGGGVTTSGISVTA